MAPRELCVVDVDQRQLAFLDGVDTWFADLRVGLPAPLRGGFDIVLTDPPYSPAGVGLFAARALEAMKRRRGCWWPTATRRARRRWG